MSKVVLQKENLTKYRPFELPPEAAISLQGFLATLIESRPGSIKASEASNIGALHNDLFNYIRAIVDNEQKIAEQATKLAEQAAETDPTAGLPKPKMPSIKEESL
jgi:hypothetical protein